MTEAILIDDEQHAINDFLFQAKSAPQLKILATFNNIRDAVNYLNERGSVDIIFCDIRMPEGDGFEAKELIDHFCIYFVFTSGYPEFTRRALEETAHGFLFKPVSAAALKKQLKALEMIRLGLQEKKKKDPIVLVCPSAYEKERKRSVVPIRLSDIISLTSRGNVCDLNLLSNPAASYLLKSSLVRVLEKFPNVFVRVNQSTLVAKEQIAGFTSANVQLKNGANVPISQHYAKQLSACLT